MHVLTDLSDMHSTPWAAQYMKVYRDSLANETPVMNLSVGQSHTVAATGRGKTYVWGWNDNGQCAKPIDECDEVIIKQNSKVALLAQGEGNIPRVKQIVAAEDRCMMLA